MLPFNSPARVRSLVGDKFFERITHASLSSADALFAFVQRYRIQCDARQKGWLRALHSPRARRKAEKDIESWNRYGAGLKLIVRDDVERMSGTRAYGAAVLMPKGGAIQPFKLICGLASVAVAAGVKIFGHSPVSELKRQAGRWICKTAYGSTSSEYVIVATNGYTDALLPGLTKSIIPLNPIQMATEPLSDDRVESILPEGQTISDSRRIIMYARREPDNRIVYGGLGKARNDGTFTGFDWLQRDAEHVFPQLKGVKWTHRWGGTIALTGDRLPHIHEPCRNLIAGLGYNGRGVAMSLVVGRALADRVLGKHADELVLPITHVSFYPLRAAKLVGMDSAIGFMRFLDDLETR